VTIPSSVTTIGSQAFFDCSGLTSVTIPDSVTSIGYGAFSGCSGLTSVTIPDSVTSIGQSTFSGCSSLKSVTIPDSVTSIGQYAFSGCSSLTSVTVPDSVTSIGESAFRNCSSLADLYYGGTPEEWADVSIGSDNEPLLSATFHNGRVQWVLDGNGVLTVFGSGAMDNYASGNRAPWYSVRYQIVSAVIEEGITSMGKYAFSDCTKLTSFTIPDSVTSIGDSAFYGCSSLTSVTIPDSVTSIGQYAFYNCSRLQSVTIPDSVTSIGKSTFYGCSSLTSVTIPDSVTSIGASAFYGCSSLTSVTIPDSVTSIGDSAFYGCSSLTSVTIPDSVTSIGGSAFRGCSSLTSVTIPDGVTSIGDNAFDGCRGLTSVTIPDSVTTIGASSFRACSSLTSVTIPDSVTSIGDYAFSGCSSLAGVYYGGTERQWNAIVIGSDNNLLLNAAIYYPTSGECGADGANVTWTLDDECTLTINGEGAMANYYLFLNEAPWYSYRANIQTVVIESGVISIGGVAFSGCSGLTSVTIPDSVTSIGGSAFSGCSGLTSVTIPDSVTSIGGSAFSGCSGLTSVTIPDSVTSIGGSAFYGCSGLTSVTIPDSVTSIGYQAFRDCSSLTSVTIPDSVTSIGESAFRNCSSLADVYYSGSEEDWNEITIDNSNEYNNPLLNATIHFTSFPPVITGQPADSSVLAGEKATFTVTATGATSYQWQYSKDGGSTWLNSTSSGGKKAAFSFTATTAMNGRMYRCVVTNADGDATSNPATLTVNVKPTIVIQPVTTVVSAGEEAVFAVIADNADSYRWQFSKNGGSTWANCTGKAAVFRFTAAAKYDGWLYRCVVANAYGSAVSSPVTLIVISTPMISTQPVSQSVAAGAKASFRVVAVGGESYQWQYSKNGGRTWLNSTSSAGKRATFTFTATTAMDGRMYRCVVTNADGSVTTNAVTLTVV
ncbi:MAG: leucine-rich repeat protein, partial [Oscillospiraceae bacterium]|nr:leucine-rich repeat protein [Oscillospiraceae bacterium]